MALLCSALSWQQHVYAGMVRDALPAVGGCSSASQCCGGSDEKAPLAQGLRSSGHDGADKRAEVPRVYYLTRTHSQIKQVVRELNRSGFSSSKAAVLGSREHYCVNKAVRGTSGGGGVSERCKELLEAPGGCSYHSGMGRLLQAVARERTGTAVDIEDLCSLGARVRGCPYFASRLMAETAEIIFAPYNYILDPAIRVAMDVKLQGAVIIIDEAHNTEDIARGAASHAASLEDLEASAKGLRQHAQIGARAGRGFPGADTLAAAVEALTEWMRTLPLQRAEGYGTTLSVFGGAELVARLGQAGLSAATLPALLGAKSAASKHNAEAKPGEPRVPGRALTLLDGLLTVASWALRDGTASADNFRAIVKQTVRGVAVEREWKLVCLNPAVAFSELTQGGVRCVILASGTLSPLGSFASELGTSFPIVLEARHCVDMQRQVSHSPAQTVVLSRLQTLTFENSKQVWAGVMSRGPSPEGGQGAVFNAGFKAQDSLAFQDALGSALEALAAETPHGMLAFFPSYGLLERMTRRWRDTGCIDRLSSPDGAGKRVLSEPRGRDKRDLEACLANFYGAVADSVKAAGSRHSAAPRSSPCRGALLLAVCRGKIAEGLDFSDEKARAVVIIGVPFPAFADVEVQQKRAFNTAGQHRGLLSGDRWYSQQAYRALNQAVGRCLRHKADYGAIILVDERFTKPEAQAQLPKWLRPAVQTFSSFERATESLGRFFAGLEANPPVVSLPAGLAGPAAGPRPQPASGGSLRAQALSAVNAAQRGRRAQRPTAPATTVDQLAHKLEEPQYTTAFDDLDDFVDFVEKKNLRRPKRRQLETQTPEDGDIQGEGPSPDSGDDGAGPCAQAGQGPAEPLSAEPVDATDDGDYSREQRWEEEDRRVESPAAMAEESPASNGEVACHPPPIALEFVTQETQ